MRVLEEAAGRTDAPECQKVTPQGAPYLPPTIPLPKNGSLSFDHHKHVFVWHRTLAEYYQNRLFLSSTAANRKEKHGIHSNTD